MTSLQIPQSHYGLNPTSDSKQAWNELIPEQCVPLVYHFKPFMELQSYSEDINVALQGPEQTERTAFQYLRGELLYGNGAKCEEIPPMISPVYSQSL